MIVVIGECRQMLLPEKSLKRVSRPPNRRERRARLRWQPGHLHGHVHFRTPCWIPTDDEMEVIVALTTRGVEERVQADVAHFFFYTIRFRVGLDWRRVLNH